MHSFIYSFISSFILAWVKERHIFKNITERELIN